MASSSGCRGVLLTVAVSLFGSIALLFAGNAAVVDAYPNDSNFSNRFLEKHNMARAAVRVPPLIWGNRVALHAQRYAMSRRADCATERSPGPYGENIFLTSGTGYTPEQAVDVWLAERRHYNYTTNSCQGGRCGRYTQVVWRNSQRLGCAMVTCRNGRGTFINCNYDPPGNIRGQRPY